MDDRDFKDSMDFIAEAIRQAGYEPYEQIYGYLLTGNDTYITRRNIVQMDAIKIWEYLRIMQRRDDQTEK